MTKFVKRYIGDAAFYKRMMTVAIPIMIQNGISQFVSMLDNIMVGRLGTEQMTGVAIANTLIFIFNMMIFGASSGAGIFGAQYYGSGNQKGLQHVFRFKLWICMALLAIGISVFSLLDEPLIMLYLKGEGDPSQIVASLGYAKDYLHIMMIGLLPFVFAQMYSGSLREMGQTIVPMFSGIASVLVNLALNTVLIFGFLGFPAMGSRGAALATVIARFVEAAIVILWMHLHTQKYPFVAGLYRSLKVPVNLFLTMLKKTVPLMANETLWAAGMALLNQCYSLHGYEVVSAMNIASTIQNVFNVSFIAMGIAIGIILGQMLGAGETEEAVDAAWKMMFFSIALCFVVGGVLVAVSGLFPKIYNTAPEIQKLAGRLIMVGACAMPLDAMANACYFTLRSGGKTWITFLFDSMFICLFTLPLAHVLTATTSLGIIAVFAFCQGSNLLKDIIGYILVKKKTWVKILVD